MVKIIGHRGAAGYAPEHTLLSFQSAIDAGCDRVELDVRLSKDNELIVIHDRDVSRVTDGRGKVVDMTLQELKKLNCPNNQKLLTLQEVVDFCKGKIDLQIELKSRGTPPVLNKLILKNDIENNVVVMSFDSNLLREMRNLNPILKIGILFVRDSKEIWELVKKIPLDFIYPRYNIVTAKLVKKAHTLNKGVYTYGIDKKDIGEKLIALGVDEIGTDFPKMFIKK